MSNKKTHLKSGSKCEFCDDWISNGSDHEYHEHCIKEHWDELVSKILDGKRCKDIPEIILKNHDDFMQKKKLILLNNSLNVKNCNVYV